MLERIHHMKSIMMDTLWIGMVRVTNYLKLSAQKKTNFGLIIDTCLPELCSIDRLQLSFEPQDFVCCNISHVYWFWSYRFVGEFPPFSNRTM